MQVGFMPFYDCAPLVYALEASLFAKYDLEVELRRENSWSSLRDRLVEGELDAAHAPATLPFLANLGLESDPSECVSGMILSLQGNGITLSRQLWDEGVRDAATLREAIYRNWGKRTYTFAVTFPFSSQRFLLHRWLKLGGIIPQNEVRIVALPPFQMFPTLKLGYVDGYCVAEPWVSLAAQAGVGVCVATSAELAPFHPEKVLMVRQSFASGSPEEHERLLAALIEACAFCDEPQNRAGLNELLAEPRYVNAPADCLGDGLPGQPTLNSTIFHRHDANEPTDERATWLMKLLYDFLDQGSVKRGPATRAPVLKNIFQRDVYNRARLLVPAGDHTGTEAGETRASGVSAPSSEARAGAGAP